MGARGGGRDQCGRWRRCWRAGWRAPGWRGRAPGRWARVGRGRGNRGGGAVGSAGARGGREWEETGFRSSAAAPIRAKSTREGAPPTAVSLRLVTHACGPAIDLCLLTSVPHLSPLTPPRGPSARPPPHARRDIPACPQRCRCAAGGQDGEVGKAQRAAAEVGTEPTIFSRIIARSVPATILYEDDEVGVSGAHVTTWVAPTRESGAQPALPPSVPGVPRRSPAGARPLPSDPQAPHSSAEPRGSAGRAGERGWLPRAAVG